MDILDKGLNDFEPIIVPCPEPLCNATMKVFIGDVHTKQKPDLNWVELYIACTCPCCKSIIDVTQLLPEDIRTRILEIGMKQVPPGMIHA